MTNGFGRRKSVANPEHLEILKQGAEVWNEWRKNNPHVIPDLIGADLVRAFLRSANLIEANLTDANLTNANLVKAQLTNADLTRTDLIFTDFTYANLVKANLTQASIGGVNFIWATLKNANFDGASLAGTVFVEVNLTEVRNLDKCSYGSPCSVDFRTLQKSGHLPIEFLRGVGFPESFIDYLPSLLNEPFQYYTCFISYSRRDEEFVDRLYADLQNNGIRCWQDKKDMPWGGRMFDEIDRQIRFRGKVLLV
ncbi:MAG: toll/interleukin-1 receptor domain-containing protein, partial [Candidatus Electryoneaceae bacterium]|nr:toll/interleukin-1 receptor domain-containing protein [Candidatus Electryoneaceae bacterium]